VSFLPKDVGGLTNKSFVQQVGVKFCIFLTEVYVIKDNKDAFNKTLNKPSKALCAFDKNNLKHATFEFPLSHR